MNGEPYAFLLVFAVAAAGFPLALLLVSAAWRRRFTPARPGPVKTATYESGVESRGDAWIRFHARYYLYAILFLVFDVEVVFLLPVAVAFTGLSAGAVLAMLVFLLLLAEGLAWAWQRGYLEWS